MKAIRTLLVATTTMLALAGAVQSAPRDVECEASNPPDASSTKERADVKAEVKGSLMPFECVDIKTTPKVESTKSRAEVKAEAAAAKKSGEVPWGEAGMPGR